MGWLWAIVVGVVATALLIAYLVDRRGGGIGMTDRDRHQADRALREQENRALPWSDISTGL